jgi:hypothetical protein
MRCKELEGEKYDEYFETAASHAVCNAIESKSNTLYVDYNNNKYKILKLINI